MRCPVLVGRRDEAAAIAGAVNATTRGQGCLIAILGEPGVGKTRLAQHAEGVARECGALVATGRAMPEVDANPLRPIAEALLTLTRDQPPPASETLAGYVPVLAGLIPHWRRAGWRPPSEPAVVTDEAVLLLLRELATDCGLLLAVEDVQWADPATISAIRYLSDHLGELPVALLLTAREGEADGPARALLAHPAAQAISLGRLEPDEVEEMAAACLRTDSVPTTVAARLARDAEGLPLLVEDLLSTDAAGGPPRRFADTVTARLDRLEAADRAVLAAAAVLGRRFDWRLLAPATGLAADQVGASLRRTTTVQLTVADGQGFTFRHALTRDAVLGALDVAGHRAVCLAVAGVVATQGQGDEVDRDLIAGRLLADAGEAERAAQVLLGAGRAALRAGRLPAAETALRLAVAQVAADSPARAVIERDLAGALLAAGQPAEAAARAGTALALVAGRDRGAAAVLTVLLARAAVATERWEQAAGILDSARRDAGGDPGLAAEIAVLEARVALGGTRADLRRDAEHRAAAAAGIARLARRPDLECEALELVGLSARLRDLDDAASAFHRALALTVTHDLPVQRLRVLNELGTVEMLRDARADRLEDARNEALRAGALGVAVGVGVNLASVLVMTGRFDEALSLAVDAEASASRLGLRPLQAAAQLMIGLAMAHRGRRREADRHLALAESLAPDDPDLLGGVWALGRGLLCLLEEDRAGARNAFARARASSAAQHARILNPYEGPELLLRCLDGEAGEADVAAAAAASVRGARWPALWVGSAEAVALGAAGDAARARSALATAMEAGRPYPVFRSIAQRLVGEAAIRDGWTNPAALLREAELTFADLALDRPAAVCRTLLRRLGHPAPRRRRADLQLPDALRAAGITAREAEVLALLADNLANREIGTRLFASPRTVEKHVAALKEKLEVPDRVALARLSRALALQHGGESPM